MGAKLHPLCGVFVVDCKLGSDPRGRCRSSAIIVAAVFKPRRGSCSTGSSKFDHSPSGVNDHLHHESSAKLIAEAEPSVCTDRLTLVSEFGSSFAESGSHFVGCTINWSLYGGIQVAKLTSSLGI